MSLADVLGWVLGAGAAMAALNVVLRRDAVVAAMYLVLVFFCLSGVYLVLGFPFVATVQILVYAGAIMVLFLFVIMLLGVTRIAGAELGVRSGIGGAIALATVVEGSIVAVELSRRAPPSEPRIVEDLRAVASLLFRDAMVLPFEITGVLLLAAMIAVVVLARRDPTEPKGPAEIARERAFDPRPLVVPTPPDAPDGMPDAPRPVAVETPA
jgi:NADH-quinone oxidoreductase subunit J